MSGLFSSYQMAPMQSIVMGAFIAITDVLLTPGLKNGLESFLMYSVQGFLLYFVFQVQSDKNPLCSIGTRGDSGDFGKVFMKTMLGVLMLWITDMLLRPQQVRNLWIQFIKFIIQGSLIWHIFNHDFGRGTSDAPAVPPAATPRYGY